MMLDNTLATTMTQLMTGASSLPSEEPQLEKVGSPGRRPADESAPKKLDASSLGHIEPVLMGYAYRSVRNRSLAEDLVHDTYVAALENQHRFEGRSTLRSWMVGILGRKIVDHYRKHRREVLHDETPEPQAGSAMAPAEAISAEQWIDTRRAMALIRDNLDSLTELERNAIWMCDLELIDRVEAAEMLGVDTAHLRVILHRGRAKLRKVLEAHAR